MLSTIWTAQRCSRIYTEEKRGRKETEVARGIKRGIKRRETDPASNQFPKCSPQSGTHKEIDRVGERREGGGRRGGDRGDLVEKKESPERERAVKPVI